MNFWLRHIIQKWKGFSTDRKIIFGWIFSLAVVISISSLLYLSKIELKQSSGNLELNSRLRNATQDLLSSIQKLEILSKRYILTGGKKDSLNYYANLDSLKNNLSRLENLIKDNPRFSKYFVPLEKTIRTELYKINHLSFSLKNSKLFDSDIIRLEEKIYIKLDNYWNLLDNEEDRVELKQAQILHSEMNKNINYFFLLIGGYILILSALFAYIISDVKKRRLLALEVAAQKKELDVILNTAPALIFVKDVKRRFKLVNKSFLDFFDVNMDSIISKPNKQLVSQNEQWLSAEEDDAVINQKISIRNIEREITLADGTTRWLNINKAPLLDENNNTIGIVGVTDDISQRIVFQNSLLKTQEELKRLNAQKDKFFSIVAHDLRSPFTGMLGFAEILSEDFSEMSEEEKKFYIDDIQLSLKNLLSLIDNLLTWARLNLNRVDFSPTEILLDDVVNSVFQSQKIAATNKKILLQSDFDKSISVFADSNMLETVIRNLVSNAIKFTNPEGVIKVNAVDEKDFIKVEIQDNGVGMKPEIAGSLFKIDAHVTTKGTKDEKGTGLGLIICKEFVEKHGGTISASSEVGKGTNISFTLQKKI